MDTLQRIDAPTQLTPGMTIHVVGIGGSGMAAIARVLAGRGFRVSGSDLQHNELTTALESEGIRVFNGHDPSHVSGADALVVSSAIAPSNPEWLAARDQGKPVLKRAELLGELMTGKVGIAVAGTHGKTTTTGMIATILLETGLDPTVVLGGTLAELGGNGRFGRGPHFIVEADEYDYMFLGLRPEIAVITNIEHDHPDLFPTVESYRDAFRRFTALMPQRGQLVVCTDDDGVVELLDEGGPYTSNVMAYGLDEPRIAFGSPSLRAVELRPNQLGGTDFIVERDRHTIGLARIRVPGSHNVRNALAALAVGLVMEMDFAQICRALAGFGGVQRRFQLVGEVADVTIIDDYAHHPTEIRATLAAARQRYPGRRLWAVWQPHTYSRTRLLADEFAAGFELADRVIALDIYRSREVHDPTISTADVVSRMDISKVTYIPDRRDAAGYLLERVSPGDVVVTLGAGDGDMVGRWLLDGLKQQFG